MRNLVTYILKIGIIFLAVIIIGLPLFISRIDWTEYKGTKGFSIKYPRSWYLRETNFVYANGNEDLIGISNFHGGAISQDRASLDEYASVFIIRFPKGNLEKGIEGRIESIKSLYTGDYAAGFEEFEDKINGDRSFMLTIKEKGRLTPKEMLLVEHDDYVYEIYGYAYWWSTPFFKQIYYHALVSRIISSVRFQ